MKEHTRIENLISYHENEVGLEDSRILFGVGGCRDELCPSVFIRVDKSSQSVDFYRHSRMVSICLVAHGLMEHECASHNLIYLAYIFGLQEVTVLWSTRLLPTYSLHAISPLHSFSAEASGRGLPSPQVSLNGDVRC